MAEVKLPEKKSTISDISKLPGNSNVSKEHPIDDRPKQRKVIKGAVTVKKQSFGQKFADAFFGEDIVDVKSYIIQDVLVPTIKATISDVIGGGVEMLLFGKVGGRTRSRTNSGYFNGYTPYGTAYSNPNNQTGRPNTSYNRPDNRYGVQEIIFGNRDEAAEVLDAMIDCLQRYDGMVSVADLYDMVGITGAYTDHGWGWTDLSSASVRRVRNGYMLVLPRPVSLK